MSWKERLAESAALINQALDGCLPAAGSRPPVIHQAMRYSLFAGGKRLRGALALASAGLFADPVTPYLPLAAALEMIHTYSLIHDDLPAMDNDDYRRGKPTCHKVYGEAVAILSGDALLTTAFETLAALAGSCPADRLLTVIGEIAACAGSRGLIGGQVVDLESEGRQISAETLDYIHAHKTGALFRAAVRGGALLAGGDERALQSLTAYADSFGLAFQITDDILDLTGDQELLGKEVQRDLELEKSTYPALFGLERSRQLAAEQVGLALDSLAEFGAKADFLRQTAEYLLQRRL
jgi:geranylgeranyl diphosphate synthase type II